MQLDERNSPADLSWWIRFGIQQVFVPVASLLVTFLVVDALRPDRRLSGLAQILAVSLCYATPAIFAGGTGYWRGKANSRWNKAGKYIWLVPACIFAIGFIPEMFVNPAIALRTAFLIGTGGGDTESNIGVVLVTFPVVACCAWSVGIKLAERRQTRVA
jgi:hypothetical protein